MKVSVVGVPLDLGANRRGTDMGPSAIRYAQLANNLCRMGIEVVDLGNVEVPVPESREMGNQKLIYLQDILQVCDRLSDAVARINSDGSFPLVLGGDHSIAMGTVAGVARHYGEMGLLWFDAHGDFNDLNTTTTGNVHGMSLSRIVGKGSPELVKGGRIWPKVSEDRVALIGTRSLDPQEKRKLKDSRIHVYTIKEIDERGIENVITEAVSAVSRGARPVHLSLDLDVLDPAVASGLGTPVNGGLSYREAHLAMELIAEKEVLCSMELCEVNPILDRGGNRTASIGVELATSALGKSIL